MHITVSGDTPPDDRSGRPERSKLTRGLPRQRQRTTQGRSAEPPTTEGQPGPSDVIEQGRASVRRWPGKVRAVAGLASVALAIAIVATDQLSRSAAPDAAADSAHRTGTIIDESLRATALASVRVVAGTRARDSTALRSGAGATSIRLGLAVGDYVAEIVCVGAGDAVVTLLLDGTPAQSVPIACGANPTLAATGLSTSGGPVTLVATPGPRTAAALAWRIRRA